MSAVRFKDQVALITGAAHGIGRATAAMIVCEGGVVVGLDDDECALNAAMQNIRECGGQADGHTVDVLDELEVAEVVRAVAQDFKRIDVLVNAVGGSTLVSKPSANVAELTLSEWKKLVAFNLDGTFLLCHEVAPLMMQQGGGKIVNVGSIAARGLASHSNAAYSAAKGGIVAMTTQLAHELGPYGVNVNAISPGVTLTDRIRARWEQRSAEDRAREVARIPLRRLAEPDDQARVICFLASADAHFVTGVTIDVTGGL
jgi:NAD(P)-dependent dehydrogenase (short-subunit alcohol dehydrogenase family)